MKTLLITLVLAAIASVQTAHAATITVTNTNDSGAGSLRQALADANDGDTIDFSVTTPATITLTSGQLWVNKSVIISGPSGGRLSVNGNAASRVFLVYDPRCNFNCVAVTISNLTITNGLAVGYCCEDNGGGISNWNGLLTITNSTISGNSAPYGGGIFNGDGQLMITNSTISGNSGGGIANQGLYCAGCETPTLTITNSTLSDNSGGGIFNGGTGANAGLTIGNTILKAGGIFNTPGGSLVTSLGYNMSDDDGGGVLTGPGDQINTNPLLGPLQDNGGPTFTHALSCGSPAIDAGDPSFTPPPDYDQRGPGFPRVVNGRIEIGAFELQATGYTAQVQPPINADGTSIFNVKRGVVPVKFTLTDGCGGGTTCALPPATIAVTRTAGGVPGQVNESVYSGPSDSGLDFRIEGCQYQYNLYSSALGVGTYRVDILIGGQVVGSATFELK
ncbi:MAG: choice-of-anchor Q domain-containing protein [Candidatus Nanopelagicales bacterium]